MELKFSLINCLDTERLKRTFTIVQQFKRTVWWHMWDNHQNKTNITAAGPLQDANLRKRPSYSLLQVHQETCSAMECCGQIKQTVACARLIDRSKCEKIERAVPPHLSNLAQVVLWLGCVWLPVESSHLSSLIISLLTGAAGWMWKYRDTFWLFGSKWMHQNSLDDAS